MIRVTSIRYIFFFCWLASHLFSTWCKAHDYGVLGRLVCGLGSKEWGSLNFLFGILLFCYKRTQLLLLVAAGLVYKRWGEEREGDRGEGAQRA